MTIDEKLDLIIERLNPVPFDESGKLKEEISKFNPTDAEIEAEYQWSMRNRQTELWEYGNVL